MPIATGTIYRIICLPEPNIQYIGSTFTTTKQRWSEHKKFYKIYKSTLHYPKVSIYPYFDEYGIDNFKLIKIKEYQVWREHQKDTKHLRVYEQLWINRTRCVNINNAFGIKRLTSMKYNKKYYEKNKEHIKERIRKYRLKPEVKQREKIVKKKYNQSEKGKKKNKEYEEKRKLIKISCSCGSIVGKSDIRRHERTKKHLSYIESIN